MVQRVLVLLGSAAAWFTSPTDDDLRTWLGAHPRTARRPRPRRGSAAPPAARRSGKDINAKVLRDRCPPANLSGSRSTPTLRRCSGRPRPRRPRAPARTAPSRATPLGCVPSVPDARGDGVLWNSSVKASPRAGRRLLRPAQCLPAGRVVRPRAPRGAARRQAWR